MALPPRILKRVGSLIYNAPNDDKIYIAYKKIRSMDFTRRVFIKKSAFSFARVRVHTLQSIGCNPYCPQPSAPSYLTDNADRKSPIRSSSKVGRRVQEEFNLLLVPVTDRKLGIHY